MLPVHKCEKNQSGIKSFWNNLIQNLLDFFTELIFRWLESIYSTVTDLSQYLEGVSVRWKSQSFYLHSHYSRIHPPVHFQMRIRKSFLLHFISSEIRIVIRDDCKKMHNRSIYFNFAWERNKMLIAERLMLILSRHSRHPQISFLETAKKSRDAVSLEMRAEKGKRINAISDLLKCKCLKKECKQFHWRILFAFEACKQLATLRLRSAQCRYAAFSPLRLCYVNNMQIFNESESIVCLSVLWYAFKGEKMQKMRASIACKLQRFFQILIERNFFEPLNQRFQHLPTSLNDRLNSKKLLSSTNNFEEANIWNPNLSSYRSCKICYLVKASGKKSDRTAIRMKSIIGELQKKVLIKFDCSLRSFHGHEEWWKAEM